ncbi:MAG TPA: metallophosphoesterase [Longimicrobiaceae bacterium]
MTEGPRRDGPGESGRPALPPERERRKRDRRRAVVRVAAVGDFHSSESTAGAYRDHFARVNAEADVLLLAGDLTNWGTPAEMRVTVAELADVDIPIVAVLGNHDHEAGETETVCEILRDRGIHVLDGDTYVLNDQVGIAGVKGYMGGFGRRALTAFGEALTKNFVASCLEEVQKLELALRRLSTPTRIALLHYAPVVDTVIGEPEQIYPFLGTDRLAEPLDRFEVSVAFHGHAHHGTFEGRTAGGVPVYNVSHHLIRREGRGDMYFVYEIPLGEGVGSQEPEARSQEEGVKR